MKRRIDWEAVQRFHEAGHGIAACAERFGFQHDAWHKAVRRGALVPARSLIRRYDWAAIQRYHDEGHPRLECGRRFGFNTKSWYEAVERGAIVPRRYPKPARAVEEILKAASRTNVKHGLLRAGILSNRCESCGISEWRGRPLVIQIDHRNGCATDHRLENLRMLCPNCHSQTETYGGKNVGKSAGPDWCNGNTPDSDSGIRGSNP